MTGGRPSLANGKGETHCDWVECALGRREEGGSSQDHQSQGRTENKARPLQQSPQDRRGRARAGAKEGEMESVVRASGEQVAVSVRV